jgi:hypothetical protein
MGKVKDNLFEGLSQEEINDILYNRYKDTIEYEEWLKTEGFVEYVNGEIDSLKPRYSESDIMGATRYASKSIIVDPSEVGKETYDMLFSEKIEEYLSLHT